MRVFGIICYLFLAILILGFIFSNREAVSVDFFPLGSTGDMPLYVLLALMFVAGLTVGLIHSASIWASTRAEVKRKERAIAQLEKEIAVKQGTP